MSKEPPNRDLMQAVLALINAESKQERLRVITNQRDLLLTDAADQLLADWQELSQDNRDYVRLLGSCRTLLARCRQEEIAEAKPVPPRPSRENIRAALFDLLDADSQRSRQRIARSQQDVLLTDAADQFLANWIESEASMDEQEMVQRLQECCDLLTRCREKGIDAAFAGPVRPKAASSGRQRASEGPKKASSGRKKASFPSTFNQLLTLGAEIERLTQPSDMPRRVEACREALTLVERASDPESWAEWQFELGNSLFDNPLADRANNIEQAIDHFKQALNVYTRQKHPVEWAKTINNLANAYYKRIRGVPADNLEKAIHYYEQARKVHTRQAFPEQWAMTQHNLAFAYLYRIRGVRANNIEQALHHAQEALTVRTRDAFPVDWARTMNSLGEAYRMRIRGIRGENIEQAISHYKQALQVHTRQDFPNKWAILQNNLGLAYGERVRGVPANNQEQAIYHLKQVLHVDTRQASPVYWAQTINNLAVAYCERIRGERAENLEQAIDFCQQALEVRTRQNFPLEWAATMDNLGNAYSDRIRGAQVENLEKAIKCYQEALEVRTRQASPTDWASTQNNLAVAYVDHARFLPEEAQAESLEKAIDCYQQVLKVRTRQGLPEKWASTQNNLAIAYIKRTSFLAKSEQADNLEQAIFHCQQALEVYTYKKYPEPWARTHNNLANTLLSRLRFLAEEAWPNNVELAIHHLKQTHQVYTRQAFPEWWARIHHNLALALFARLPFLSEGEQAENREQVIDHLKQALEVYTPHSFSRDCRQTAHLLGSLLYAEKRFSEAREALVIAHKAIEMQRGDVQREEARRKSSEENAEIYRTLVHCCLLEEDEVAAFAYAAASKGRAFVDMLASAQINLTNLPDELQKKVNKARDLKGKLDVIQARLMGESAGSLGGNSPSLAEREALNAQLGKLRQQENELWQTIRREHPDYFATQASEPLTLDDAQELARALNATLVSFYRHADGWVAFVIRPDEENLRVVELAVTNEQLEEWGKRFYKGLSKRANNILPWLPDLYHAIIAPLRQYLPPANEHNPARLVLAPASKLHLFPLAALPYEVKPGQYRYLADDYVVSITPNLALMRRVVARNKKARRKLCALAYPGKAGSKHYLFNVVPEVRAVAGCFAKPNRLRGAEATPQAAIKHGPDSHVVHYACHGQFEMDNVSQSGLLLAGGWLRVRDIFNELRLPDASLAVLSACVTGQVELRGGDELTGLVQAFMYAGTPAVIASLWPVNDSATRHLFEHFYTNYTAGMAASDALRIAQQKLRSQGKQHPYYWAAFQPIGAVF